MTLNMTIFARKISALKKRIGLPFLISLYLLLNQSFSFCADSNRYDYGKLLFRENCGSCHEIGKILTGPDLKNIRHKRTDEWLLKFIRNSAEMIKSGDPEAIKIFKEFKEVNMPPAELPDSEIFIILDYIENYQEPAQTVPLKQSISVQNQNIRLPLSVYVIPAILFFWIVLSLISFFSPKPVLPSGLQAFISAIPFSFHFLFVFILLLITLLNLIGFQQKRNLKKMFSINEQTVAFSHQQHYTDYQINCVYCHVAALKMKTANIPGVNHCMKCHHYIRKGTNTGEKEINKLVKLSETQKDIEWVPGYRLSRHVHFDHALHVVAGEFQCIDCHSDPSDVRIYKGSFRMKWCLDCHKRNAYRQNNYLVNPGKPDKVRNDCMLCHY